MDKDSIKVWIFQGPNVSENPHQKKDIDEIYKSLQEGKSRFGWGDYDLNDPEVCENLSGGDKRILKLKKIKSGDWIVHVNCPEWGECTTAKVLGDYGYDEGLTLFYDKKHPDNRQDYNHNFQIDTNSILTFSRAHDLMPPTIHKILRVMGRMKEIKDVTEFLSFISNVKKDKSTSKPIIESEENGAKPKLQPPMNQILYGPPGTGKTYITKQKAVEIITGRKFDSQNKRDEINEWYKKLYNSGHIDFITFHQSYGYEDFVEGIRPVLNDGDEEVQNKSSESSSDISYKIEDGIFKKLCNRALLFNFQEYKGKRVWQIKLGKGGEIVKECFAQDEIRVQGFDWFDNIDVSDSTDKVKEYFSELIKEQKDKGISNKHDAANAAIQMKNFCLDMQVNDWVVAFHNSKGEDAFNVISGIGIVTGKYKYYEQDAPKYSHRRKVKWLWKKEDNESPINIYDVNLNKKLSDLTLHKTHITPENLLKKLEEHGQKLYKNHALIIDEINRGNISKILGELITLLEEDKRLGEDEALKVTLPYSNERFGVPSNLYIIGTMNTADRSIAFLDTALRRRFNFTEMMPKYKKDNGDNLFPDIKSSTDAIDISKMLEQINTKICKELNRDYQIGHSYFISKNKSENIGWLKEIFMSKICPLLEEYFYDRRSKIKNIFKNSGLIANTNNDDDYWEWAGDKAFSDPTNYIKIYKSENGK